MKFALVKGGRCEAEPKLRGECPGCASAVLAKCGTRKLWHWAHISVLDCDRWWETETGWHRGWKNEFPVEWQEVRQRAPDGEWHIADVKIEGGNVLEFQYSNISHQERTARENFHKRLIWVVNGTRLKKDLPSFQKALAAAACVNAQPLKLVLPVKASSIVERWNGSECPVYLDFGEAEFGLSHPHSEPTLWRLQFRQGLNYVVVTPVSRRSFIEHHRRNTPLRGYSLGRVMSPLARRTYLPAFERYLLKRRARKTRKF
ncbi:competence protein CoiA [Ensifer sp. P24N7]|uniref:competence protein CoiA n=1 Tax=Sinorhizobium sp. P24N7 TaxID=3348358 RepID=UPI0035F3DD32